LNNLIKIFTIQMNIALLETKECLDKLKSVIKCGKTLSTISFPDNLRKKLNNRSITLMERKHLVR